MRRYTVVIADSSEDFREALQSLLTPFCMVYCVKNGKETTEAISIRHPDVLVLDLTLPGLDGISLLGALTATGHSPEILATSCFISPYVLESVENLGVACLMEKPCDLGKAAQCVRKLLQERSSISENDRFSRISGILLQLGFTAKLRGYTYLREAVLQYTENPERSIYKEIYPSLAAAYGVSAEDVEHSIRGAIQDAWRHGFHRAWERYFTGEEELTRPANAQLITVLSEYLAGTGESTKD